MGTLKRFITVFILSAFLGINLCNGEEVINMQHIGHHNDHLEHFSPFDQPDVYYDNVNQAIIIDGDGAVDYYDVEIASVTNFVPVILTQVNGYYDTIDISSLPADEYSISITTQWNDTFVGYFEIE